MENENVGKNIVQFDFDFNKIPMKFKGKFVKFASRNNA